MYTTQSTKKYPIGIDVATPTGPMYIEWKALCLKLGVTRAKTLLRNWETAQARTALRPCKSKAEQGVFIQSNTYGCMDYWDVTNIRYRGSLPSPGRGKSMEATWGLMKRALLYKLF